MKISAWYIIPFLICVILLAGRRYICDYIYLDLATDFEDRFGYHIQNPYNLKWNFLRDKLISAERFLIISTFIYYLKPDFSIYKYFIYQEKRIPIRFLIVYWQYSFGDVVDRVVFDTHEYGINDVVLHIYITIYLLQTIRLWLKK